MLALWPLQLLSNASAQIIDQCQLDTTDNRGASSVALSALEQQHTSEIDNDTIIVLSENSELLGERSAEFNGNVTLLTNSGNLATDRARYDRQSQRFTASGAIRFSNPSIAIESKRFSWSANQAEIQLLENQYQFLAEAGRGESEQIVIASDSGLRLGTVSFTTCPQGNEDWRIEAQRIDMVPGEFGTAIDTTFYIGNLPVFYLPYFVFPLSDERSSGWLFPEIATDSRTGIDYSQAYYWNIAPNYDITITPRLMTKRGIQLLNEARYLTRQHKGNLVVEYLANDTDSDQFDERYFVHLNHQGKIGNQWYLQADISNVSDFAYVTDLGSGYYNRSDTHLLQQVQLAYSSASIQSSLTFRDFQTLGDFASVYRAVPELTLNYRSALTDQLELDIHTEAAYFTNQNPDLADAFRFHVQPTLTYPILRPWGEFTSSLRLYSSYYRQDKNNDPNAERLSSSVSRNLVEARLFGKLVFERDTSLFDETYEWLLEPQAQYLFTSYENQDAIGLYDTSSYFSTYDTLLRGQEFTGIDRINDNNQVTLGFVTRLLSQQKLERLKLGIGQVFYIEDARILNEQRRDDRSALVSEFAIMANQRLSLTGQFQFESEAYDMIRGAMSAEYAADDERFARLSYRFLEQLSDEKINQLGFSFSYPLKRHWQLVGRVYQDIENHRTIEHFFGLQYESCCWAIRVTANRYLVNQQLITTDTAFQEFDTRLAVQFILKGLSSNDNTSNEMLNSGLFGQQRKFYFR